jgi:hypothetical protein
VANGLLIWRDIGDLPLAVPNLNSAAIHELESLNAGRVVVPAANNSWLTLDSISLVYSEEAVLDHSRAFELNWSE